MPRNHARTIFLRDCSQDQIRFSECKDVSDALARPAAERESMRSADDWRRAQQKTAPDRSVQDAPRNLDADASATG